METPARKRNQPVGLPEVQAALLAWYDQHRRDLPWRRTRDPYAILVSEVMLQQTQVDRVLPKYREFLKRFPTFNDLAMAPTADVIRAWTPLGYNRRAVRLQAIARQVGVRFQGKLPKDLKTLRSLPGVGEYTASALASFVHRQDVPVVDTNVRRVLNRVFRGGAPATPAEVRAIAKETLPRGRAADWSQALMDLGATLCTTRRPACRQCPLEPHCLAAGLFKAQPEIAEARSPYRARRQPFAGSSRFYRGRIVERLRHLAAGDSIAISDLGGSLREDYNDSHQGWLLALVRGLKADGLVTIREAPGDDGAVPALRVCLP